MSVKSLKKLVEEDKSNAKAHDEEFWRIKKELQRRIMEMANEIHCPEGFSQEEHMGMVYKAASDATQHLGEELDEKFPENEHTL